MNILILVTGSISAYKAVDLANSFRKRGHVVRVALTLAALKFIPAITFTGQRYEVFIDNDEWAYRQGVLHIDLARWADAVVLAPATANTLAKYVHGITDNLVLSVLRAYSGRVFIAPAMNTVMWENSASIMSELTKLNVTVIPPVAKLLACGEVGVGGLADIADIREPVLSCAFPLRMNVVGYTSDSESFRKIDLATEVEIPIGTHVGAFGAVRKHHIHEGVDLYCPDGTPVYACASATVVKAGDFTGESVGSPWWEPTQYLVLRHDLMGGQGAASESEYTVYGEIKLIRAFSRGDRVKHGECVGHVKRVLKMDKGRPMSMLHVEQYAVPGNLAAEETIPFGAAWDVGCSPPKSLRDPTRYLRATWQDNTGEP